MTQKSAHDFEAAQKVNEADAFDDTGLFPIVGVGASAGGLSAFTKLLNALPADTGMAFVLVQHLDPKHVSLLPDLMSRATNMPVAEVKDAMLVEPNHVYIMPPNHSLALLHGALHLMPRPDKLGKHLPIDDFLRTLADDRQSKAIGVILSGTASDGTLGVQAIKAASGITFAQSEDSAEYSGMPHNAIAAGYVDFILTPEEIARELTRIAHHPYLLQELPGVKDEVLAEGGENLNKIFVLLRSRTGNDFTYYKHSTIRRRIKRRMLLHQIERMQDYVKFLQLHAKELDALFQDITINVTSFFRDPETFDALKNEVFPRLMEGRPGDQALRIWVPGCSTGEEVYSVAIALREFLGDRANTTPIQIFASDIDDQAISRARQGIYPESIREEVDAGRLQRFFIQTAGGYQICRAIRDSCVFTVQSVIKDPPFSRIDLISCRNLMIYLGTVLQKKVLHTFHYALRPNGFLMLGTSETIGSHAELFSLLDKKCRIYAKKHTAFQTSQDFMTRPHTETVLVPEHTVTRLLPPALSIQQEAEHLILEKYGPPGVVINQDMQILNFRGQTGPYIEPASGSASLNLLKMARQELLMDLRTTVQQAIKEHSQVRKEGVRIRQHEGYRIVNLQIIPIAGRYAAESNYLVLFEAGGEVTARQKVEPTADKDSTDAKDVRIRELENELLTSREYMQSIIEAQEATNEELQSANEEIQSTNEEFQSTNEELETAKEELQSTNEELATINEEHENRNQELRLALNDLSNLLASIDLSVVILREDLRVRRFTPAAKALLNLIDTDIGRPIGNIRPNVNIPDLERRVQQVMESMQPQSVEVQDRDGHWYSMRLRPYRTLDNRIEGVVLVFIDIDSVKDAGRLRAALQHETRLAAVVRDANDAVTVQDFSGHILAWNKRATEMYGYSEEEALRLNAAELVPEQARDDMHNIFSHLQQGETVPPCESSRRTRNGRLIKVWLTTSVLLDAAGKPASIALTERELS